MRLDFYESGIGDTIVVTFPDGGIGIIDAHPSRSQGRPDITTLVTGKRIHFVCLTHPHADHGIDLVPVLQNHPAIGSFWHTVSNIRLFFYRAEEAMNFPSEVRDFATQQNRDWANFLIDLFGAVTERKIPVHQLRSDLDKVEIAGVEIHVLSPNEAVLNEFDMAMTGKPGRKGPDANLLSAVLALRFGPNLVLLGADAVQRNWTTAYLRWKKLGLPKACILKIPHHGARNALDLRAHSKLHTYLDMCSHTPPARAVLFAGDRTHPDRKAYKKLRSRTEVFCLSNGMFAPSRDPLNLKGLVGARAVSSAHVCQPVVSFELDVGGAITTHAGASCDSCAVGSQWDGSS